jgi:hypothetical protein
MIITPAIFEGEINIGQVEQEARQALVQWFIDRYEPAFLAKLLGSELASELLTEYEVIPHDEKWDLLADRVRLPIAYYVYFYFQKNDATSSTGAGEVETEVENAVKSNVQYKMLNAWNTMVNMNLKFREWIDKVRHIYPEYRPCISDLFCFKNTFGL